MSKFSGKKFDFKTNPAIKLLIGLVSALLISLMFPHLESIEADYTVGMVWSKEDLIAPFSFPIYKSENVYQKEVEEAKTNVLPVFDLNSLKESKQLNWLDSLNNFFTALKKYLTYGSELRKETSLPEEKRTTSTASLNLLKSELHLNLDEKQWMVLNEMFNVQNPSTIDVLQKKLIQILNEIYNNKIINITRDNLQTSHISYRRNKIEEIIDLKEIIDPADVDKIFEEQLRLLYKNQIEIEIAKEIGKKFIYYDFIFNKEETDLLMQAVVESVSKTFGIVRENERIVSKHDPINEIIRLKLESYRKIRNEQTSIREIYLQQAGRFLFVCAMLFLIALFLYKMRKSLFEDNIKLILLSSIILLISLFAYLSLHVKVNYPIEYMVFVPVAAILLTIIFDSRLAFYCIVIVCILVAAIRGGDYDILVPNFAASLLVIYSVRDIVKRSQIFVSMIYILLGYGITITAMGLERYDAFYEFKDELYMAAINAVLSPILAYGLLIFYEKVFRVATDLVYLELSDFNNPLLRELASKAPGTFHHSIVMGNLSEQAAKEIGANQILTRVGCYYHDIGKIASPEYFVENQLDAKSKHEQLNPSLSAKMIIAHVRNGIRLAEKYRIPKEIIDFIPMHHGTNLISYFYEKAKSDDAITIDIHDYIYRYPGPKPQTKETGIVMLSDAVEAATRSIEDPTPAKIETQIDQIIKARFIEGELDECDLTLKDLTRIKYSFMKSLVGIHHHRIKYPEQEDEEKK